MLIMVYSRIDIYLLDVQCYHTTFTTNVPLSQGPASTQFAPLFPAPGLMSKSKGLFSLTIVIPLLCLFIFNRIVKASIIVVQVIEQYSG